MTWDAGPCLPAPDTAEPVTVDELRALLIRLGEPPATRRNRYARAAVTSPAALYIVGDLADVPEIPNSTKAT